MNNVSVITVTYNNAIGLKLTLESLKNTVEKPLEVIIVDGGSTDNTKDVVDDFRLSLNIKYICEPDDGIYDAMNKGCCHVTGNLVHYLNAGDAISENIYVGITVPCRLNVMLLDDDKKVINKSKVTHNGYGYCHQGIIFPAKHKSYNTEYKIAADLDALINIFPKKVLMLPLHPEGEVYYDMSGISANRRFSRDIEIAKILFQHKKYLILVNFIFYSILKYPIPKSARRYLRKYV